MRLREKRPSQGMWRPAKRRPPAPYISPDHLYAGLTTTCRCGHAGRVANDRQVRPRAAQEAVAPDERPTNIGWSGRTRTFEWQNQKPTREQARSHSDRSRRVDAITDQGVETEVSTQLTFVLIQKGKA
jgi:hypothetical protein